LIETSGSGGLYAGAAGCDGGGDACCDGGGWAARGVASAAERLMLAHGAFAKAIAGTSLEEARQLALGALDGAAPDAGTLSLHTGRLASGDVSRAQVAVDIALSQASPEELAADAPAGHWVADPFDDASGQPARLAFADPAPSATAAVVGVGQGWFM
jgi:hypothetical protein